MVIFSVKNIYSRIGTIMYIRGGQLVGEIR